MLNILITGGAGFIGSNLADHYCNKGERVIIFDNLSRDKTKHNVDWLQKKHPNSIRFIKGDVRTDTKLLSQLMEEADAVFHLAGQVAVTTSVKDPLDDFNNNAIGTLNVLEALRMSEKKPPLVYSSTNKVYGNLEHLQIEERDSRYSYKELPLGVSEDQQLDFHSPYGCSKGAADQYVRDYSRIYGLKTVVFRQSCIYGYRQFGIEDQGWISWFIIATILKKPITVYGDGKQMRDVLFINDLCKAYELALKNIDKTAGKIYNIGGGSQNTLSILELFGQLENIIGTKIRFRTSEWRPGDQKVFVCDIRKAYDDFGWKPEISPSEGVKRIAEWVRSNKGLF